MTRPEARLELARLVRERNRALTANAVAVEGGREAPHSADDLEVLRLMIAVAAREARAAGANIDDLVPPHVGTERPPDP
ncbi:MAG: hypothetical protein AB7V43_00590 [Acidimicrobiia bacterium]